MHRTATPRRRAARPGQSIVEYALILAFVALLCLPAIGYLQRATGGAYDRHQRALGAPSFWVEPATADDCKDGRWATFTTIRGPYTTAQGTFRNQGDCQSWVSTGGTNPPGE